MLTQGQSCKLCLIELYCKMNLKETILSSGTHPLTHYVQTQTDTYFVCRLIVISPIMFQLLHRNIYFVSVHDLLILCYCRHKHSSQTLHTNISVSYFKLYIRTLNVRGCLRQFSESIKQILFHPFWNQFPHLLLQSSYHY